MDRHVILAVPATALVIVHACRVVGSRTPRPALVRRLLGSCDSPPLTARAHDCPHEGDRAAIRHIGGSGLPAPSGTYGRVAQGMGCVAAAFGCVDAAVMTRALDILGWRRARCARSAARGGANTRDDRTARGGWSHLCDRGVRRVGGIASAAKPQPCGDGSFAMESSALAPLDGTPARRSA